MNNTTTEKKRKAREEIEQATRAFLARGGKIDKLAPENSGYQPKANAFYINVAKDSRAT